MLSFVGKVPKMNNDGCFCSTRETCGIGNECSLYPKEMCDADGATTFRDFQSSLALLSRMCAAGSNVSATFCFERRQGGSRNLCHSNCVTLDIFLTHCSQRDFYAHIAAYHCIMHKSCISYA